jgi:hypothetical protein
LEKHLPGLEGGSTVHDEFDHGQGRILVDEKLTPTDTGSSHTFKPIYGRRSEAEIKFNVTID